jgi:hypothetical protein
MSDLSIYHRLSLDVVPQNYTNRGKCRYRRGVTDHSTTQTSALSKPGFGEQCECSARGAIVSVHLLPTRIIELDRQTSSDWLFESAAVLKHILQS